MKRKPGWRIYKFDEGPYGIPEFGVAFRPKPPLRMTGITRGEEGTNYVLRLLAEFGQDFCPMGWDRRFSPPAFYMDIPFPEV